MTVELKREGKDEADAILGDVHRMFARFMAFPLPTVTSAAERP